MDVLSAKAAVISHVPLWIATAKTCNLSSFADQAVIRRHLQLQIIKRVRHFDDVCGAIKHAFFHGALRFIRFSSINTLNGTDHRQHTRGVKLQFIADRITYAWPWSFECDKQKEDDGRLFLQSGSMKAKRCLRECLRIDPQKPQFASALRCPPAASHTQNEYMLNLRDQPPFCWLSWLSWEVQISNSPDLLGMALLVMMVKYWLIVSTSSSPPPVFSPP